MLAWLLVDWCLYTLNQLSPPLEPSNLLTSDLFGTITHFGNGKGGGWEGRLHKCGRRSNAGRLTLKMAGDGVEWGWEGRRAGKEKTLTVG